MSTRARTPKGWCGLSGLPEPDATIQSAALASMLSITVDAALKQVQRDDIDGTSKEHETACRALVGLLQRHGGGKGEPEGVAILHQAFADFMAKHRDSIHATWDQHMGEAADE